MLLWKPTSWHAESSATQVPTMTNCAALFTLPTKFTFSLAESYEMTESSATQFATNFVWVFMATTLMVQELKSHQQTLPTKCAISPVGSNQIHAESNATWLANQLIIACLKIWSITMIIMDRKTMMMMMFALPFLRSELWTYIVSISFTIAGHYIPQVYKAYRLVSFIMYLWSYWHSISSHRGFFLSLVAFVVTWIYNPGLKMALLVINSTLPIITEALKTD